MAMYDTEQNARMEILESLWLPGLLVSLIVFFVLAALIVI